MVYRSEFVSPRPQWWLRAGGSCGCVPPRQRTAAKRAAAACNALTPHAGVPPVQDPWREQAPDGVQHTYAAMARQWPDLKHHLPPDLLAYIAPADGTSQEAPP